MAILKLRNSTILGDYKTPYIVAEINTSHFGDIDLAKKMVQKAKEVGCDCVKFQSWSSETLYSKSYYNENPIAKRFVKKFSLSKDRLEEIASYSKGIGIDFSSTPYSKEEVDFLAEQNFIPYIKIASMELNNFSFLSYIASKKVPIVLSTGMGDVHEIHRAIKLIEKEGNFDICILHCVSIYPPKTSTVQLKNIIGLRKEFPNYPIGFSDHSSGVEIGISSVALGACLIEKHFTLDKTKIGMDNQMALEPDEMKSLVDGSRRVQLSLGQSKRVVSDDELQQRKIMRRSIVASRDLESGTILCKEDLNTKRPGTGITADKIDTIIGMTIKNNIDCDSIIKKEDLIN